MMTIIIISTTCNNIFVPYQLHVWTQNNNRYGAHVWTCRFWFARADKLIHVYVLRGAPINIDVLIRAHGDSGAPSDRVFSSRLHE